MRPAVDGSAVYRTRGFLFPNRGLHSTERPFFAPRLGRRNHTCVVGPEWQVGVVTTWQGVCTKLGEFSCIFTNPPAKTADMDFSHQGPQGDSHWPFAGPSGSPKRDGRMGRQVARAGLPAMDPEEFCAIGEGRYRYGYMPVGLLGLLRPFVSQAVSFAYVVPPSPLGPR